MNYQRIYDEFIASRRTLAPAKPFDIHHIVPRCLGGTDSDDNLIALSAPDHLFAHILLARIHGGFLTRAAFGMLLGKRYTGRRSRNEYAWLRAKAAAAAAEAVRAANARRGHGARLGIKHTDEAIAKMRANRSGIPRPRDAVERSATKRRGVKQSAEHIAKRMASKAATLAAKGHQASFGKPRSPEAVAKTIATKWMKRMLANVSYSVSA